MGIGGGGGVGGTNLSFEWWDTRIATKSMYGITQDVGGEVLR